MTSSYIGLRAIEAKVRAGLEAGVNESAEDLMPKIKADTPVLTGTLVGGEQADPAVPVGADAFEARVHTGAGADEYAIIQHQRKAGHKFVRGPLLAHVREHSDTVAAAVRKAL